MPNLSERAILMPSSPIRKLAPFANAAKERGLKVYHLNIGQPDLDSPQIAIDAIKKFDKKILEYSPSDGFLSLRKKLVEYYDQYQIKLTPEDIIVTGFDAAKDGVINKIADGSGGITADNQCSNIACEG